MKVEVELDRLENFLLWNKPECKSCQVHFCSEIDCPYKSGSMRKNPCINAIIKYLKGEDEE